MLTVEFSGDGEVFVFLNHSSDILQNFTVSFYIMKNGMSF